MTPRHIYHISSAVDWGAAQRAGVYTTSTRGVTLEQEGFIHASRSDQVAEVWRRYYAKAAEPFVLLTIDPDRLLSPWREDPVGADTYPHVYGPINVSAVVRVQPLDGRGRPASLFTLALRDAALRIGLLLGAMVLAALGALLGEQLSSPWAPFLCGLAGLAIGLAVTTVVLRRRS